MSFLIVQGINGNGSKVRCSFSMFCIFLCYIRPHSSPKGAVFDALEQFHSPLYSVECLAHSRDEEARCVTECGIRDMLTTCSAGRRTQCWTWPTDGGTGRNLIIGKRKDHTDVFVEVCDWRCVKSLTVPLFRYCASRAKRQPGYIGSYAMDGMVRDIKK